MLIWPPAITELTPVTVLLPPDPPPITALSTPVAVLPGSPVIIWPFNINEPEIPAEPVNGNGLPAGAYDADKAFNAYEAVVARLAVPTNVVPFICP